MFTELVLYVVTLPIIVSALVLLMATCSYNYNRRKEAKQTHALLGVVMPEQQQTRKTKEKKDYA